MDYKKKVPKNFKSPLDMSKKKAASMADKLREAIEYHDRQYYVKDDPKISDAAYDRLLEQLKSIEEDYPSLKRKDSPTRKVGAKPVSSLKKVKHKAELLSLEAAKKKQKIKGFYNNVKKRSGKRRPSFMLEPKYDGFSVEAVYKKGKFSRGSTRGDGKTGEDITRNLRTIGPLALNLNKNEDYPDMLAVRGEVFIPKKKFIKLNKEMSEKGKRTFANPRNAAAGIMRQLDPSRVSSKPMDLVFYEIIKSSAENMTNHSNALKSLRSWGLKTGSHNQKAASFKDISQYHKKMKTRRESLEYEIDGIVIKTDDYETRERLGERQNNPRWAIAWKFKPRKKETTVRDIVVQVGKSGMLTPVALLDPVDVGGVTVSRATLHNADEAKRKDIRKGDTVKIERAGDVIPEVVKRRHKKGKKRKAKFKMPSKCPSCGTKVHREGAYYFCPAGLKCRAQLSARITHYASRKAMDITGLGKSTVRELVDKEMINDLADIYGLKLSDIRKLDGFAQRSAKKLRESIDKAKKPQLDEFIYALGIRHVGHHYAFVLTQRFESLDRIRKADKNSLNATKDIGEETAESIKSFFSSDENDKVLKKLKRAGIKPKRYRSKQKSRKLSGKTIVFTGSLENYSRDEAKRTAERLGARASSSVSSNTDYLVAGDGPGSKLDEAKKHKVKIIDEKKFQKLASA